MPLNVDFSSLKTSWTKYDIVQVMEVIYDVQTIEKFKNKEAGINEPILRSFLGIDSLADPIPDYWIKIQDFPKEKKLFALLAALFTHGGVVNEFATKFSTGNMKGVFILEPGKQYTNIRSALIESEAAQPIYRRTKNVPFDFSPIYQNGEVGTLFKEVLRERLSRVANKELNEEEFYEASIHNNFPDALSLTKSQYGFWLEGNSLIEFTLKDTFIITPVDFFDKFKAYVHDELTRHNLDFVYDIEFKDRFYLVQKPKFNSLIETFDGIKPASFLLEQLSESALKLRYNEILAASPDIPKVGNDILRLFQHAFSLDLDKLADDKEFKNESAFLINNHISRIDSVRVKNFYSIKELNLENLCSTNEIYLLGENGDGKSLVLMAIFLAFNQYFVTENTEQEKTGKIKDLIQDNKDLLLIGSDEAGDIYGKRKNWLNQFFAYGAHRGRYSTDNADKYGFMSLFDGDQVLTHPVSWLKDRKLAEFQNQKNEVTEDSTPKDEQSIVSLTVSSIQEMLYEILEKNVNVEFEGTEVYFYEKGSKLKFDQLSEGYKSVIIFVCDLIFRLVQNQPTVKSIQDLKGIVMVDEIDLHLHPKWQFNIVKKLRALFPKIQFIFSTHSPAIIQGASEDAIIYRVFRNAKDGQTKISDAYHRKNLDHLMINSLVTSPLFGMDSARMNVADNDADTSDSFLLYKINKKIGDELSKRKNEGKEFISEAEIDDLIDNIFKEDLGDDQN